MKSTKKYFFEINRFLAIFFLIFSLILHMVKDLIFYLMSFSKDIILHRFYIGYLCLKAKKLRQSNKKGVPGISSQILFENRGKAIDFSFQGKFFLDEALDPNFNAIYNINPITHEKNTKIFQAVLSLIISLEDEITSIPEYEQYIAPIFTFLIGNASFEAPFGIAELELYYWTQEQSKQKNFFLIFDKISDFLSDIPPISFKDFKDQITNNIRPLSVETSKKVLKKDIKKIITTHNIKTTLKIETKNTEVLENGNQYIDTMESNNKTIVYTNSHSMLESVLSKRVSSKRSQEKQSSSYEIIKNPLDTSDYTPNKNVKLSYSGFKKDKKEEKIANINSSMFKTSELDLKASKKQNSINKDIIIPHKDSNISKVIGKEQFKNFVSEKFKDTGEKGDIVTAPTSSTFILSQSLNINKKDTSLIHFRISQAMESKRRTSGIFEKERELESREKLRKLLDIGKVTLVVLPQDYQTQWSALLQIEFTDTNNIEKLYANEFFISLTFTNPKTNKTVFIDYGPYTFELLPSQKIVYFPILISIEGLPRNIPIRLSFRTKSFEIVQEQTIKIPSPQNLNRVGCLIKDFFVDETIGPAQIYADIHFDSNIKYKGVLQLFVFNQLGMRNLWEKKIQIKSENNLKVNERIFIPPDIHFGRLVLGLKLEGKTKNTGTWRFIEFLPKVNSLIAWDLIGLEELHGVLKAETRYQFLPVVVFNAILRQPELSFIITSDHKSTKNKIILKEKIKDSTYLGMLKMLKNRIELKIREPGFYKIFLTVKTDDGDVPISLISEPLEFKV